jgi:hypothetical protein
MTATQADRDAIAAVNRTISRFGDISPLESPAETVALLRL